ncbi:MAG: hypothetical protein WBX01_12260 [Nitrososphaeraceae archaeon]
MTLPSTDWNTISEDLVNNDALSEVAGAISRIVSSAVKRYNCILDDD